MKIIVVIILALSTLKVSAQNHHIGIAGGLNWTNVTANNLFRQTDGKQSLSGGFTYEYFLKQRFSMGSDVIYNQRGFSVYFKMPTGERVTIEYNYDYISLPLKTAFYHGGNKKVVFTKLGLIPALLINAKTTTPTFNSDGTITGMEIFNVKKNVTKFDLAGLVEIGGGYKIIDRLWLTASFIYQHSLTLISNPEYFLNSNIRHNGLSLNVGLKWTLLKE